VNGYFAGLLTKVGVYSLLRVFVMVFRQDGHAVASEILLVLSGFTMLLGVLGAICQWEMRRILSWHIISQVGYMVMGIGLAGSPDPRVVELAIAGTIFYVVHHIIVKSSLFLIGGIAERVTGSQRLEAMGGALELAPGVAALFLISGLSLAGLPPFSGFLSKFVLVRAGLSGGNYVVVAASIATSFLTLYSMSKIWVYGFWGERCREHPAKSYRPLMAPTAVLVALTVVMGAYGQPFLALASRAARDVHDPSEYVRVVLGADAGAALALRAPAARSSRP
jgi:multicomponent Na+:H+ antiporter subunit D